MRVNVRRYVTVDRLSRLVAGDLLGDHRASEDAGRNLDAVNHLDRLETGIAAALVRRSRRILGDDRPRRKQQHRASGSE